MYNEGKMPDLKDRGHAVLSTPNWLFIHHICLIYLIQLLSYAIVRWSFLEVTTSSQYNDSIQAYAAGAVEAAVTSEVILNLIQSCCFILLCLFFFNLKKLCIVSAHL